MFTTSCDINPAWVAGTGYIPISVRFPIEMACVETQLEVTVGGGKMQYPFQKLVQALETFSFQHNYEQSLGELWFCCGILTVAVLKWKNDELKLVFNQEREKPLEMFTVKIVKSGPNPTCLFSAMEETTVTLLELYTLAFLQHLIHKVLGTSIEGTPMPIEVPFPSQYWLKEAVSRAENYNDMLVKRYSVVSASTAEAKAPSILRGIRKNSPLLNDRFKKRYRVATLDESDDAGEFQCLYDLSLLPIAETGAFPDTHDFDDLSMDYGDACTLEDHDGDVLSSCSSPAFGSSVTCSDFASVGTFPYSLTLPGPASVPEPVASAPNTASSTPASVPVSDPAASALNTASSTPVPLPDDSGVRRRLKLYGMVHAEVDALCQNMLPFLQERNHSLFSFYQEIGNLRTAFIDEAVNK